MAYIEPGSVIRMGVASPLTKTYENTLYFANAQAQYTYFYGATASHVFSNTTYQRWDSGELRVEVGADDIIDCNYMMFQNTPFSSKWYYAFITDVEYVNNETALVRYEIDVIQTWMFNWTLEQCLVERNHTPTDAVGDNLVEEDIYAGAVKVTNDTQVFDLSPNFVAILATCDENGEPITGGSYSDGIYLGLNLIKMELGGRGYNEVNQLIGNLVDSGDEDSIVAIYQFPEFIDQGETSNLKYNYEDVTVTRNTTLDGYAPKNNKLLCYPYNYLEMTNNCGESKIYRWEQFTNNVTVLSAQFRVGGVCAPSCECMAWPRNYNGQLDNFDEGISYTQFPQCSWVGDVWKAWYAQNSNSANMSVVNTMLNNAVTGAMIGGGVASRSMFLPATLAGVGIGAVAGGVLGATSYAMNRADKENTPAPAHGPANTGALNVAAGRCEFGWKKMSLRADYAAMVDDYFNLYGYAINRVMVPSINARPHWTYVKTVGCDIGGQMPQKHKERICRIFDNGIRFWTNATEIGNYSLDNSPA